MRSGRRSCRPYPSSPTEEPVLECSASIKVHDPCPAGVLVELSGEFDISCLEVFGRALKKVASLRRPAFVDLSGVTFMDAPCVRALAYKTRPGANPLRLCRPSEQFRLSLVACETEEGVEILADDDPGYEAVVAESCRCSTDNRPGRRPRSRERRLYLREPVRTPERAASRQVAYAR